LLVGALVVGHNVRELPRRKLPPREPNFILRWLMLAVTVCVAGVVLFGGLFVQFVISAGTGVISPHLPFWVFLVVGSLWAAGAVTGVVREFYRQLRPDGHDGKT
jgi:F0F1-type ATP synthase assembly protein I